LQEITLPWAIDYSGALAPLYRRVERESRANMAGAGRPPGASHNQGQTVFEQAFKNIDDALRKEAGCTTELDYTEQTSWLLLLNSSEPSA